MFENLDDPKTQLLMMMGLGLLGGAPGQRKNFGADLAHGGLLGLQGYGQAKQQQSRLAEQKQEAEMRQMRMDELRRSQQQRQQIGDLAQRSFGPVAPQPSVDDNGLPMPEVPKRMDMQGFAQGLMGIDPMLGAQFMPKPQAPKYHVVNGALVPEPTAPGQMAQPVYQAPEKTPDWKDPEYVRVQSQIRAAGKPQISFSANMPPLERKEQAEKGALNVKSYGDLQSTANAARREIALLSGLEKLNLDTNALTPANSTVSAWVAALGGGEQFKKKAAQGEGFTAFTKDLVLQRQLAQKGPQTESDARRLEQTMPQLGNQAEANKLIMNFAIAQNQRLVDQERFYADWWKKHKTYEGADDAWFSGKGGTSLWDEPRLKKFQTKGAGVIDFNELP